MYLDKSGNYISYEEYKNLFIDNNYKTINKTIINNYIISTVWDGACEPYPFNSNPFIFETMVFENNNSWQEIYCDRYYSEHEAMLGHIVVVYKFVEIFCKQGQLWRQ